MGEVYCAQQVHAFAREIIVWGAELARCCAAGGGIRRGGLGALYPWE
jgi:hypothetical protein